MMTEKGEEVQVLDYSTQQFTLFPILAASIAYTVTGIWMDGFYAAFMVGKESLSLRNRYFLFLFSFSFSSFSSCSCRCSHRRSLDLPTLLVATYRGFPVSEPSVISTTERLSASPSISMDNTATTTTLQLFEMQHCVYSSKYASVPPAILPLAPLVPFFFLS